MAKLTPEAVAEIRSFCIPKKYGNQRRMAEKFGVSESVISVVVSGERWRP
jgi:hypothetical protein